MHRRLLVLGLSGVLGLGVLSAPAQAAPPVVPDARSTGITLITGDRVTLSGSTVSVQRGPGRSGISFASQTVRGHRFVIPSDALGLLRAGRLDKRLFDVTELTALGTGDQLPLIITYPGAGSANARSAIAAGDARVTRDLSTVGALAVRADLEGRASIWSALTAGTENARTLRTGVQKVWLDGKRKVSLDKSVPQIGAPAAWATGNDGTGVTVAVLDTGSDATRPDLAGQIAGSENFTGAPTAADEVGHGTHVASTIAGTGAASGGRYKGVAPGAKVLNGKVCETEFCEDSAILAGMAWAAERAPVVNLSLGGSDTPEVDPLEQAVTDLTARFDTLFVIAAGNSGGAGTVGSPSTADAALSVGAVDADNQIADFSSKGPRIGDGAVKPDITAPGVEIVAAQAAGTEMGTPGAVDGYVAASGTSMATPHVAGAAALLTQQHPTWSSKLRKNTLIASAQPTEGASTYAQGAGRVDVARQITQTVTADEGSLSFGVQVWPHDDDQPVTRTLTYRNSGTAAVELTLAVPGAPFSVADTRLTVPAGGTASTTVTADTRGDLKDGPLGAVLTATAPGGVRVSTALGVVREVESYDVTVRTLNRDGTPSLDHVAVLIGLDQDIYLEAFAAKETEVLRVPKGRYGVFAWIFAGENDTSMLTDTEFVVDGNRTLELDGRKARPVRVSTPQSGAANVLAAVNADWVFEQVSHSASLLGADFDSLYAGPISAVSRPFFLASVNGSFAVPGADESFRNSPETTDLAYYQPGRMFSGLRKSPRFAELATIKSTFGVQATGVEGYKSNNSRYSENSGGWSVILPFDLPFKRTEYVNTDAPWAAEFGEQIPAVGDGWPEQVSAALAEARRLKPGRVYTENWNRAVFGPAVTQPPYEELWATRQGDSIIAAVPLFGDGAGHPGYSSVTAETSALFRGNTKIGEGNQFEVPAATATYRLEASATRGAPHTLSTEVRGSWTFRSGHVAGESYQPLPLHTVRLSPKLDITNTAPAGRRFEIPLTVEHQPGAKVGKVKSVRAEISYDDGKTWQKADVRGAGNERVATVRHPGKAGFASLRVSAADSKGNTVSQTVIRAYRIR